MKIAGRIVAVAAASALAFALAGCGSGGTGSSSKAQQAQDASSSQDVAAYADIETMDFEYTDRDKDASYDEAVATKIVFSGASASVEGPGANADGSTVTIGSEGTYLVSGTLDDGQLRVNVGDGEKVQVVLAGASIHNSTTSPLFVESADKCFVTLAPGTQNQLSDGDAYVFDDGGDEPCATLFSKDDLTINGTGSLKVAGAYKHGIYSKDDLVVTGGSIDVTSVADAVRGKDSVRILDGTFNIQSGEDAVKASRDDDPAKGYVSIDGGTFSIQAGDDAVHGETYLRTTAGSLNIADCNEGLEAMVVAYDGGKAKIVSRDDALNASAPSSASRNDNPTGGPRRDVQGGMDDANENCQIYINGGELDIQAQGDAIDSNGAIQINGGNVRVTGPTSDGDGALDYAISAECNGGDIVIVGSAGMAQDFSGGSQPFVCANVSGEAGQQVAVTDEAGATLVSYTPTARFSMVLASCPKMAEGYGYNLDIGGTVTAVTASTTSSGNTGFGPGAHGSHRFDPDDDSGRGPGDRPGGDPGNGNGPGDGSGNGPGDGSGGNPGDGSGFGPGGHHPEDGHHREDRRDYGGGNGAGAGGSDGGQQS